MNHYRENAWRPYPSKRRFLWSDHWESIYILTTITALSVSAVQSCAMAKPSAQDEARVASYEKGQLECIELAKTRFDADACRDAVKARYGRLDAGR